MKGPEEGTEKLAKPLDVRIIIGDFRVVYLGINDGNRDMRSISKLASTVVQASDGIRKLHSKRPNEPNN